MGEDTAPAAAAAAAAAPAAASKDELRERDGRETAMAAFAAALKRRWLVGAGAAVGLRKTSYSVTLVGFVAVVGSAWVGLGAPRVASPEGVATAAAEAAERATDGGAVLVAIPDADMRGETRVGVLVVLGGQGVGPEAEPGEPPAEEASGGASWTTGGRNEVPAPPTWQFKGLDVCVEAGVGGTSTSHERRSTVAICEKAMEDHQDVRVLCVAQVVRGGVRWQAWHEHAASML